MAKRWLYNEKEDASFWHILSISISSFYVDSKTPKHKYPFGLEISMFPTRKTYVSLLESTYKKCLREEWGKFTGYQLFSSFWLKVARTDEDGNTTRWDRGTLPIRNLYPQWWMLRFGRIKKVTNWIWMLWFMVSY